MNYYMIKKSEKSGVLVEFILNNGNIEEKNIAFSLESQRIYKEHLLNNNLFSSDLDYETGELINACLHFHAWKMAIEKNEPVFLLEDNSILCKNFQEEVMRIISKLHQDWDILVWGHDSGMIFGLGDGRLPVIGCFAEGSPNADLEQFGYRDVTSSAFQLLETSGISGYSVSAKGARGLFSRCTPIKNSVDLFKSSGKYVKNSSIGHVMGCNYMNMQSYVIIPPLCIKKRPVA